MAGKKKVKEEIVEAKTINVLSVSYRGLNNITSGSRGDIAYALYDGVDIHEISCPVAMAFREAEIYSLKVVKNIWSDKDEDTAFKTFFDYLSPDAYKAVLNANLRGVDVHIYYRNEEEAEYVSDAICLKNIIDLSSKREKIAKMIAPHCPCKDGFYYIKK